MRALSLTQPWASLVAMGAKQVETRSWSTTFRGGLVIHAAKGFPPWAKDLCATAPFSQFVPDASALPLGAIVAVCYVASVEQTELTVVDEQERAFGDYAPGRWAWRLSRIRALPEPIPCRGALGLWTVPDDVAERLVPFTLSI